MSWSKNKRDKHERSYHHGNLRQALIDAALELIADKGPAGFTFAEAARSAGVSPAAPYRHFKDRDALIADVARLGFERFEAMLSTAWNDGNPDVLTALQNIGQAYLAFARTEPAFYTAMFESGVPPDHSQELARASDKAFDVLRQGTDALCATLPPENRPPALMISLHIWSLAHGTAALFARGDDARRKIPMPAEDLLEASILIYLQGLGIGKDAFP